MAIKRDAVKAVALPQEIVTVKEVGGDVILRGFDMPQMLRFHGTRREQLQAAEGESREQMQDRAAGVLVPLALHMSVVLDDGMPVYTQAQWAAFGGQHPDVALSLFRKVMALGGADLDHEKKD
jgi:hypothetical protein